MSDELAEEREVIDELIEKFKSKVKDDESIKKELQDFERDIRIEMNSGNYYELTLEEAEFSDIETGEGEAETDADIILSSDKETLKGLLNEEIGVMQAYAKNKIKVDAPLTDMLKFKKLM
ncbi:MAG: SCP2 sterol-binding domain-containing protein [Candidatus Thermoplasmatota archaeon]